MRILSNNKKAFFEYEILERFCTGVILLGCEVKQIMDGKIDISSAWIDITDNKLILKQAHIPHYVQSQSFDKDVDPMRERILLANKNEIKKLGKAIAQKGLTVIPLNVHYSDTKKIKLEIGIARGKKEHDKRDAIKKKDIEREVRREI